MKPFNRIIQNARNTWRFYTGGVGKTVNALVDQLDTYPKSMLLTVDKNPETGVLRMKLAPNMEDFRVSNLIRAKKLTINIEPATIYLTSSCGKVNADFFNLNRRERIAIQTAVSDWLLVDDDEMPWPNDNQEVAA